MNGEIEAVFRIPVNAAFSTYHKTRASKQLMILFLPNGIDLQKVNISMGNVEDQVALT